MSNSVVVALIKFGETLNDESAEPMCKLRVLHTLNEVTLTLSELSESGVGRAVRKLKNEPGELGKTARTLVTKWKQLLDSHLAKESTVVAHLATTKEPVCDQVRAKHDSAPSLFPKNYNSTPHRPKQSNIDSAKMHETPIAGCSNQESATTSNSFSSSTKEKVDHMNPTSVKSDYLKTGHKRKSKEIDSIDSSSGLSFLESLNVISTTSSGRSHPKKHAKPSKPKPETYTPHFGAPSAAFTTDVLSSLEGICDRPDIVHHTAPVVPNNLEEDPDFDDGDLKFKSKKVLWVPKASRTLNASGVASGLNGTAGAALPTLVDLCLDVLERNLSRIDHVGNVPWELLARAMRHASAEDLGRIERYNPQFTGQTDELWQKHIQRDFRASKTASLRPGETWAAVYARLARDEKHRLDRIISNSARKIKQEMESRRTTLTTDVIAPRQFQRRSNRPTPSSHSSNKPSLSHGRLPANLLAHRRQKSSTTSNVVTTNTPMTFKPSNACAPDRSRINRTGAAIPATPTASSAAASSSGRLRNQSSAIVRPRNHTHM